MQMSFISEAKFAEICDGIRADREVIVKHNPIGSDEAAWARNRRAVTVVMN